MYHTEWQTTQNIASIKYSIMQFLITVSHTIVAHLSVYDKLLRKRNVHTFEESWGTFFKKTKMKNV